MRDYFLVGFLLLLPALGALGHDLYLAYNNTVLEGIDRFWLSDAGWLWINYSPETYDWALATVDAAVWNGFVDPILQESAFFVALAPFCAFLAILFFMMIFGLGSFEGKGLFTPRFGGKKNKNSSFSFSARDKKKKTQYKRK